MREVMWGDSREQGCIRVPLSGSIGASLPHTLAQSEPGHPAALSPGGVPSSLTAMPLAIFWPLLFSSPLPPFPLPSPYGAGPGPQQNGLCGHQPPRTIANLEGCSRLLESCFKNINSCSKDRSQLSNHSKPNNSFLKTDFWEISLWLDSYSVFSWRRNSSSQRDGYPMVDDGPGPLDLTLPDFSAGT